ncbi:alpha-L-fucosidase isoform X2 [Nematostella vectensis]|uniref:alpha-L-fucosidase isoform X2 n=1 Tax=Nematostella vectensis TaxID=45351 RepID=UPI0013905544|nr:alpha-L-fucosidase isoform X2 [Nematostella vectensis]
MIRWVFLVACFSFVLARSSSFELKKYIDDVPEVRSPIKRELSKTQKPLITLQKGHNPSKANKQLIKEMTQVKSKQKDHHAKRGSIAHAQKPSKRARKIVNHPKAMFASVIRSQQKDDSYYELNQIPYYSTPDWESLDARPLPSWYEDAKFGIFVHWGLYSVPGVGSEWFWYHWRQGYPEIMEYMWRNYPPGFSYADFASKLKAEMFNATAWHELIAKSGARYFVFTGKHHDGFVNWNTSYSWNWNSVDNGPHRDIVGELASVFHMYGDIKFGLYYSLYEWFNPLYLKDKRKNFMTDEYVKTVVKPQLRELVNKYMPDILWADGDWEAKDSYWGSKEFLTWLYNDSPVASSIVVNDRWGRGCGCNHGGVLVCADRFNPGHMMHRPWENAMTIDKKSWGYRRNAKLSEYLSTYDLIRELASTVSCGGNLLMNIAPAPDGSIPLIFQERLEEMGDWLQFNGEAIYGSRPWKAQNDSRNGNVWYTTKDGYVYAIVLEWPTSGTLLLGAPVPSQNTTVTMLGLTGEFSWYVHYDKINGAEEIPHEVGVPETETQIEGTGSHLEEVGSHQEGIGNQMIETGGELEETTHEGHSVESIEHVGQGEALGPQQKDQRDGNDKTGNATNEKTGKARNVIEISDGSGSGSSGEATRKGYDGFDAYAFAIEVPAIPIFELPSKLAWVFKIKDVK